MTAPSNTSHCVLITIPISHYCEKARWALDYTGVRYQERAHLQVVHWVAVARAGGRRTAPVLVCGDRVFADSSDILREANSRARSGWRLYLEDPAAVTEIQMLEEEFDTRLGPHGRRWMYDGVQWSSRYRARIRVRRRPELGETHAVTGVSAADPNH